MSTGDALVRLGRPAEARVPLQHALRMAERDGHMLPALDAHIVLGQAALALGERAEAVDHIFTAIEGASEHRFANVLADALVTCGRVIVTLAPGEAPVALAWIDEIARRPDTTALVRRDAEDLLAAHAGRAAGRADPRGLEDIAREARALLLRVNPSPATRSPAVSSAPAPTRA